MFKRLRLTRREHKSRRAEGKPHIELNVCWKWYMYPGQKQQLDQVLKTAQQQLEEILCLPPGTILPAEVPEIGQKNDRVLDRLNISMSNRAVAVDMQLPGFNDMLDGVMHRTHTNLIERINGLEEDMKKQRKELEKKLETQEVKLKTQEGKLETQEGNFETQREEFLARLESQRERSEAEIEDLKNRVKVHDEALDKLFCGS